VAVDDEDVFEALGAHPLDDLADGLGLVARGDEYGDVLVVDHRRNLYGGGK
jgi:hypothetical protein